MKNNKELQRWFDNLSLEDRLTLQLFVVRLYCIGDNIWQR